MALDCSRAFACGFRVGLGDYEVDRVGYDGSGGRQGRTDGEQRGRGEFFEGGPGEGARLRVDAHTAARRGAAGSKGAGRTRSVRVSRPSLVAARLTWRGRLGNGGARRKRSSHPARLVLAFELLPRQRLPRTPLSISTTRSVADGAWTNMIRKSYGFQALRHLHRVTRCPSTDLTIFANQERILLLQELHTPLLIQEPVCVQPSCENGKKGEGRGGNAQGVHASHVRHVDLGRLSSARHQVGQRDELDHVPCSPAHSSRQLAVPYEVAAFFLTHEARFPTRSWSGSRAPPETAKRPLLGHCGRT